MDQATLHMVSGKVFITCTAMLIAFWLGDVIARLNLPKSKLIPICVISWAILMFVITGFIRLVWL